MLMCRGGEPESAPFTIHQVIANKGRGTSRVSYVFSGCRLYSIFGRRFHTTPYSRETHVAKIIIADCKSLTTRPAPYILRGPSLPPWGVKED